MQADVIIIGGGVLGVSLAYHLSLRDQHVIVLERESQIASHASGKNAGLIMHYNPSEQLCDWTARSVRLWPDEIRHHHFRQTGSAQLGVSFPIAHHGELFEVQKGKGAGGHTLLLTEADGVIDPPAYVQALAKLASGNFASFRTGCEVTAVEQSGREWIVETRRGEVYRAPWVVNAAGAWLNEFLQSNSSTGTVAADPFARTLFVVDGWKTGSHPVPAYGIYWDNILHWYEREWQDDTRLVSICDKTPARDYLPDLSRFSSDPGLSGKLRERLSRALPTQIHEALVVRDSWHCFRTYAENKLPIWGEDSDAKGFFWLCAFGGYGMSTSFAASLDAARVIAGEAVSVPPEFSPARAKVRASS